MAISVYEQLNNMGLSIDRKTLQQVSKSILQRAEQKNSQYNVESATDSAATIASPTPKATLSPEEEFKEIGADVAKNNKYNALVLIVLFVALAGIVVKNNRIKKRK